jgi:TPR repeat protein
MFLYAQCLEDGKGIAPSLSDARTWYKRAAEGGMPYAVKWCQEHGVELTPKKE